MDVLGDFGLMEEPIAGPGAYLAEKRIGGIDVENDGLPAGTQHAPNFGERLHLEVEREVMEEEGGRDTLEGGIGIGQFLGEGGGKFKTRAIADFFVGDGNPGLGGIDAKDAAGGGKGKAS